MKNNLDIIQAHYAASARQDTAAMMADVSPDVRWTEMAGFPCAGTWVGPQQVLDNVFAVLGSAWQGYQFKLESLIDGGDRIVATGNYHGSYLATGKSMVARVAHVWQLEQGKIVKFEQFTDTLLVAQAMS
jgi:ketosteroid isomerase-like protein